MTVLGVIGGSGFDASGVLEQARWVEVSSPFGTPSDALLHGSIAGLRVVFLPRHGRGHRLSPDAVPYRANIDALKRAGVTDLITLNAAGSLRAALAPGTLVRVDQFIDQTHGRERSFFGPGCVAHVSLAEPVCPRHRQLLRDAADAAAIPLIDGGTYLSIDGPQYATRAEEQLYQSWGADLIGMTNMPEARLAREAELCFSALALVTDYGSWWRGHAEVDASRVLRAQAEHAAQQTALLRSWAAVLQAADETSACGCRHALERAIVTAAQQRDPVLVERLRAVAGRVLER